MNNVTTWLLSICVVHHSVRTAFAGAKCSTHMDVGFLLDSSGSIKHYYSYEKKFLIALTNSLGISETGSHVGVITFSNTAKHSIRMNNHYNMKSFSYHVNHIPLMNSITRIDLALQIAKKELFQVKNGARTNTRKLLILLTDGVQSDTPDAVNPTTVADELRKMGVTVMAVGMGSGVDKAELDRITKGHAYTVSTFNELVSPIFINKLTGETCKVSKEPVQVPVNSRWEPWGAYTVCSKKCGGGSKSRKRVCIAPKYGGKPCAGAAVENTKCNTQPCPAAPALPLNAVSYSASQSIRRNSLLCTIPKISRAYTVKFDFKPKVFQEGWTNIIHLTTGGNCCGYGQRIPGVWFYTSNAGATKNRLLIVSAVNGNGNYYRDPGVIIPRGEWTTVLITQQPDGNRYRYTVKVGNKLFNSVINTQPREFSNVKVYASDNWYNAAQGSIRNLIIIPNTQAAPTLPSNSISYSASQTIRRNSLLCTIPKMSRAYTVKFDFNPKVFQEGWTNIIHLTTGGDCCGYGQRIPGVWFHTSNAGATKNRLHISSAVNGNGNYYMDSGVIVPRGEWTTVLITQQREGNHYRYTVKVGNVQVGTVINTQPREFSNVKVYASDRWCNAAQGSIRNLMIIPNTIQVKPKPRPAYTCHHWTPTDLRKMGSQPTVAKQRSHCEKTLGFKFSKGNNKLAPGCGSCWCCRPLNDGLNVTVCERKKKRISCTNGRLIKIVQASYGRKSRDICPNNAIKTDTCHSKVSLRKVQFSCNGKSSCELQALNSVFGDPCHGTYKYLTVTYQCYLKKSEKQIWLVSRFR